MKRTGAVTTAKRRSALAIALILTSVTLLAGCASSPAASPGDSTPPADSTPSANSTPSADSTPSTGGDALAGTIVVDAAASLTDSFGIIAKQFEKEHPGARVTLNFGGSSALAASIVAGAPVDVFAAASPATMATVTDAKLASAPQTFASNSLEIAVPAGNPGNIAGLPDFSDPAKTIALCAPEVPCGAAAVKVFAAAGITAVPDTLEEDVKAALTKVQLGEVDAALVYRTDVQAAGDKVEGIEFAESSKAITDYPIAPLTTSDSPEVSAAFVAYVLGDRAQQVLKDAGFASK